MTRSGRFLGGKSPIIMLAGPSCHSVVVDSPDSSHRLAIQLGPVGGDVANVLYSCSFFLSELHLPSVPCSVPYGFY